MHFKISIQNYEHNMNQLQTMPSYRDTTISTYITIVHTFENPIIHLNTHSARLKVIKQLNRAFQSKTIHITTKQKKCWLLAQLFPYQSAKSTSASFYFKYLGFGL